MLNVGGKILSLNAPAVMAILNITPDSFFSGSRVTELDKVTERAGKMLEEGATFIDVGGYSTRPGAQEVSETEEQDRVLPVIEVLKSVFPEVLISIDTFRATVAENAVKAGAVMINDIAGGQLDEKMFETVGRLQVPYVLMHSRGTPQTMIKLNNYENLLQDIFGYFEEKIYLLRHFGVKDIILDLGFGFAKDISQNYELLNNLNYFDGLECPMLVGISRKSMIYKKLNIAPEESLNGTTVLNTIALMKGANILRVHDVKETVQAVKLFENITGL
jgi:dihydropteroate synthase